jgi:hypothetical protein
MPGSHCDLYITESLIIRIGLSQKHRDKVVLAWFTYALPCVLPCTYQATRKRWAEALASGKMRALSCFPQRGAEGGMLHR